MRAPIIRSNAGNPSQDGEFGLYTSPEATENTWFNPTRRVVFVNGMANTGADHAASARGLSLLQACPVVGIYNRTDGFWLDLGQCITDKLNMTAPLTQGMAPWRAVVQSAHQSAAARQPGLSLVDFVGRLIADNPATFSLYQYLVTLGAQQRTALRIYCHSQGNLVTSNALTACALALGDGSVAGIEVNSFGSPCRYWPSGISRTNYAFTFDPVSWLDLRAGFDSVKVGFVAAHGFNIYMQNDAEFVCNRFRWGSFGLTANMDEEGLADFCVRIGNNPPRLKRIFQRLQSAHWTDSDDVTHYYVTKMRTRHDGLMRQIAAADRSLIQLLIALLDAGWTTGGEYAEMEYLRGLI